MKTIVFSMITFFTSVVMMSTFAKAQTTTSYDPVAFGKYVESICGKDDGTPEYQRCYKNQLKLVPGSSAASPLDDSCKSAKDGLSKAQSEFSKACGQFSGLSVGGTCEKAYNSCDEEGLNNYDADEGNDTDEKTVSKDKYASCPMPAIKDAKKAKEEIDELKKKVEDYESSLNQVKDKVGKAKTDISDAESLRLEENTKAKEAYEEKTTALSENYEKQVKDTNEQISAFDEGIRKLLQEKNDQGVQRAMDKVKIEGICQEIAEKQLSAKITAEANNVSKNQQKQRNLQAQLTLKSKGRTAENEAFRQREIARCKVDKAKYEQPMALLELNYANNIEKINNAITLLTEKISKAQKELREDLPKKAQEQLQKAEAQYQEKQATIKQQFDSKIGTCVQGANALTGAKSPAGSSANCSGLQGDLARVMDEQAELQNKLDTSKADLEYYKELLRAASSVLKDPDASDVLSLTSTGGDYKSALKDVIDACVNHELVSSSQMTSYRRNFELAGGDKSELAEAPVSTTKEVDATIKAALATPAPSTVKSEPAQPSKTGGKQRGTK